MELQETTHPRVTIQHTHSSGGCGVVWFTFVSRTHSQSPWLCEIHHSCELLSATALSSCMKPSHVSNTHTVHLFLVYQHSEGQLIHPTSICSWQIPEWALRLHLKQRRLNNAFIVPSQKTHNTHITAQRGVWFNANVQNFNNSYIKKEKRTRYCIEQQHAFQWADF